LRAEDASELGASNVRSPSQEIWALADAELREIRRGEAQTRIILLGLLFARLVIVNVRPPAGGDIRKALHTGDQLREPSRHLSPFHVIQHEVSMLQTERRPGSRQCPSSSSLVDFRPCCITQAMM
jgi:hypothetical protein